MKKIFGGNFAGAALCAVGIFLGATGSSHATSMTAYQNTYSVPAASSAVQQIFANFSMPQFDPVLGTLQSVDVTISTNPVSYSGVNSTSVNGSANFDLHVAVAGLAIGLLNQTAYTAQLAPTMSGVFAAAQNTQVNTPALWSPSFFDPYIGTSTISGIVGLAELIGYQSGNSYFWFDTSQSFGPTSFSVEIDYNYAADPADPAPVPEPCTFLLFGAGLAGAGFLRRKVMK